LVIEVAAGVPHIGLKLSIDELNFKKSSFERSRGTRDGESVFPIVLEISDF
jgi:hypothetical protein